MNRLLKFEFKRVLKKRLTLVVFLVSIFFAFILAYIPVIFENAAYLDDTGNLIEIKKTEAIRFNKELQKDLFGVVTPNKLQFAVEEVQNCLHEYEVESRYDLTRDVYSERISPYSDFVHGVREVFVDPNTGFAPSDLQIDSEKIDDDYYSRCEQRVTRIMEIEQKDHPDRQAAAVEMYKKVQKPFVFYGTNGNAIDYQLFLSFVLLLSCTVLVAPVFSLDYQTGAEDILRCSRYGGIRLTGIKLIVSIITCTALYLVCMTIYIIFSNVSFGWECTKTSIQMLYSITTLADWNVGQMQLAMLILGLLSVLATVSLTLFISSKNKNVIVPLVTGIVICILPFMIFVAGGMLHEEFGLWIQVLLPSNGAGMTANFFDVILDLKFLNLGNFVVWVPYLMVVMAISELLFFTVLTICTYNQYKEY